MSLDCGRKNGKNMQTQHRPQVWTFLLYWCISNNDLMPQERAIWKKILGTFKPKGFITSSTSASIQIWSASGSTQGTVAEIHSSQWVRKNVSLYMICIDLNGRNLSRQILLFVIFHLPNIVFFHPLRRLLTIWWFILPFYKSYKPLTERFCSHKARNFEDKNAVNSVIKVFNLFCCFVVCDRFMLCEWS